MTADSNDRAGTPPSPRYRARLLGDFALFDDQGRNVTPTRRKGRALIAYLALASGSATRDRLAGLLWGERAEEQARASLRQTLYELRELSVCDVPLVGGDRADVTLVPGGLVTDVGEIEALAAAGDLDGLRAAVLRWSGPLLADLNGVDRGFSEWLSPTRERTHTGLIGTILNAIEMRDADARTVHAIGTQLQTIDPLNEQVLRVLMRADAKAGDVGAAHRRFNRFAEQLSNEMQAKPSAETRRLLRELGEVTPAAVDDAASVVVAPAGVMQSVAARMPSRRLFVSIGLAVAVMLGAGTMYFLLRGDAPATTTAEAPSAIDATTLELYKRAQHALMQRTEADNRAALALLEDAVSRQPTFSRGWSALAFVQLNLARGGDDAYAQENAALSSARRALELDPSNGDAYLTLAWHANGIGQNGPALDFLEKGLSLEPRNTELLRTRGQFLLYAGCTARAVADLERAHALDPLDPRTLSLLTTALRDAARNTEAALMLERGLKRFPGYRHLVGAQMRMLILDGRYDEAERILTAEPLATAWLQELARDRLPLIRALNKGAKAEVDALAASLLQKGRANDFGNEAVWQLAALGRYDDAYALLKTNYASTYSGGGRALNHDDAVKRDWMTYDPEMFADAALAPFRRDPAFLYVYDDGKMLDHWLAANTWPDFCKDPALRYDCKKEAQRRLADAR